MFPWNSFPFNLKQDKAPPFEIGKTNVDDYVQKVLSQAFSAFGQDATNSNDLLGSLLKQMPASSGSSSPNGVELFESFQFIFIHISVPDEKSLDRWKVYHTTNQLIIEDLEVPQNTKTITLPALVNKKKTTAVYKNGILEIILQKKTDMQYTEVGVSKE
ncbi:Hsp20/alpha crystallin family protein [Lederbergia galactosidilytica]|uniref:Hsp20/alpha crystallin family protein n=1 Tax=Lederbergia galactosidilytica TaxID=217031 RepID=UPI00071713F3|nr:Hsp20/alpha crystallin family protein [Lederbergia galactosidilytica]MBP1913968.1 hypothetical protein [Lederbergia galactosidilytica]